LSVVGCQWSVTCIVAKTENEMDISCWQKEKQSVGPIAELTVK